MVQDFLHISELPEQTRSFARRYVLIYASRVIAFAIAETFVILYMISKVSPLDYGILVATLFIVQGILDYPSGALGDYIGQQKVMIIAFISYSISVGFLIFAETFREFLLVVIFQGIGMSQESGAIQSWFDTRYRNRKGEFDRDNMNFGAFKGRLEAMTNLIRGLGFILGGLISVIFSRKVLFFVYLSLLILTLLTVLNFMTSDGKRHQKGFSSQNGYWFQFKAGISFIFSKRAYLLFFVGLAFIEAAVSAIWYRQLLFPYYNSYSGSDEFVGLLRTSVFLFDTIWLVFASNISKRVKNSPKALVITSIISNQVFFTITLLFILAIPPTNSFILLPFLGTIFIFQLVGLWDGLMQIFLSRTQMEIIPDEIRNSVYSIVPTLAIIFILPISLGGGWILSQYSFNVGIIYVIILSTIGSTILWLGVREFETGE